MASQSGGEDQASSSLGGGAASICGASPRGCKAHQQQLQCARPLHGIPWPARRLGEQDQGRSLAKVASAQGHLFVCSCAPNVVRAKRRQQNNSTRGDVHNNMNKSISAANICCFWQGSAGDPRGIRWGSSGDPHGFRGIRPVVVSVWPIFGGSVRGNCGVL